MFIASLFRCTTFVCLTCHSGSQCGKQNFSKNSSFVCAGPTTSHTLEKIVHTPISVFWLLRKVEINHAKVIPDSTSKSAFKRAHWASARQSPTVRARLRATKEERKESLPLRVSSLVCSAPPVSCTGCSSAPEVPGNHRLVVASRRQDSGVLQTHAKQKSFARPSTRERQRDAEAVWSSSSSPLFACAGVCPIMQEASHSRHPSWRRACYACMSVFQKHVSHRR